MLLAPAQGKSPCHKPVAATGVHSHGQCIPLFTQQALFGHTDILKDEPRILAQPESDLVLDLSNG